MKKLILLQVIILCLSDYVFGQWQQKDLYAGNLSGIQFVDEENGWVQGSSLFRTTDGGATWNSYDTRCMIFRFADKNHGWGLLNPENTEYLSIWNTVDGGANWVMQKDSLEYPLDVDFFFTDTLNGWFFHWKNYFWAGDTTCVYHTVDGGETWELTARLTGAVRDMFFIDSLHGFLCGSGLLSGSTSMGSAVAQTVNGGLAWTEVTDFSGEYPLASSIIFSDPVNGWFTNFGSYNDPHIFHTVNGGISWFPQCFDSLPGLQEIAFPDSLNGWAVGLEGTVIRTTNGGTTWDIQDPGVSFHLYDVCFTDPDHGWISGNGQSYLYTENGGITGIRDNEPEDIVLFPNPASSEVNIRTKQKILSTEILNIHGQQVLQGYGHNPVDISKLLPGTYLMRMITAKGTVVKKFQKCR